jgi:hypothetical protein
MLASLGAESAEDREGERFAQAACRPVDAQ